MSAALALTPKVASRLFLGVERSVTGKFWRQRAEMGKSSPFLPASLGDLAGKGVDPSQIIDPENKIPYEYRAQSETTYELCATFSAAEETNPVRAIQFWHHGKGRTCFTLDVSQPPVW